MCGGSSTRYGSRQPAGRAELKHACGRSLGPAAGSWLNDPMIRARAVRAARRVLRDAGAVWVGARTRHALCARVDVFLRGEFVKL